MSDQTVGNILKRNGVPPSTNRDQETSWTKFIKNHQDVIAAGDFFTTEVVTPIGLITYYVLFFIHIGSRTVHIAGITPHPNERWMKQVARNITIAGWGFLSEYKYLIHDRDSKFCESFRTTIAAMGIEPIRLPPKSPKMNCYSERFVRSIKEECLNRLIFFREESLRKAIVEYTEHYHEERNHQGKDNLLLFPDHKHNSNRGNKKCNKRLNGLLRYYYKSAA